ncbi:hypothetical protein ACFFTN_01145 [Aminobacter aganoensis]|uniref:Uncharacterized protein n=1 Tax=Aminobacter aganoensis TaxID=83264 RepID=A0A7X0F5J9_9HYPH|nr:hypothetical protein [Aminobacter aganoensis]MBB6353538.1 hypothetical protein [Aminobacter aganoensis]
MTLNAKALEAALVKIIENALVAVRFGQDPVENERHLAKVAARQFMGSIKSNPVAWTNVYNLDFGSRQMAAIWREPRAADGVLDSVDVPLFASALEALPQAGVTEEMVETFRRPGMMVFLDGRNEHGSHVIPSLPTNMEIDGCEGDMPEFAEEIISAAEALGFAVGDCVWTEWLWNKPQIGDEGRVELDGYWEFVRVNPVVSRALAGQPLEAALSSQREEAVPVGWKLVPVEPTEAMCRSGESSKGASSPESWVDGSYTPENVELIWKDMLAAAPASPVPADAGEPAIRALETQTDRLMDLLFGQYNQNSNYHCWVPTSRKETRQKLLAALMSMSSHGDVLIPATSKAKGSE